MIINKTEGFCVDCKSMHNAEILQKANDVYFKLYCPEENHTVKVSNDAELFKKIRSKSISIDRPSGYNGWFVFRYIDLTNHCNFDCPICFAQSSSDKHYFKDISQVKNELGTILKYNGGSVMFSGGEALLHPDIREIVRYADELNLRINILTNGLIIDKTPGLILELVSLGVWSFTVQFDSFSPSTHDELRANRYIAHKKRAMDFLYKHNIRFCITTVLYQNNLQEINKIILLAAYYAPVLHSLNLVCLKHVYDNHEKQLGLIFREDIIHKIAENSDNIDTDEFFPFPAMPFLNFAVNPDCSVLFYMMKVNGKSFPVTRWIDLERVYRHIAAIEKEGPFNIFRIIAAIIGSVKQHRQLRVIQAIFNLLRGRGNVSLLPILVGDFMDRYYLDRERLRYCGACYVQNNKMMPACLFSYINYEE